MSETILGKINVTKIVKEKMFKGAKGTYLDILIIENRNGPDEYGNTHMIVQGTTKEERDKGIKGAILGNGKPLKQRQQSQPASEADGAGKSEVSALDDEPPF